MHVEIVYEAFRVYQADSRFLPSDRIWEDLRTVLSLIAIQRGGSFDLRGDAISFYLQTGERK